MVVQQYGEYETGFSKHNCSFLQEMTSFLKAAANLWWDTRSLANTTWTSNQFIQGQIHSRESFRRGRKHGGYLLLEYSCRKSSGKHFGSIAGSVRITRNTHTKCWLVLNKKRKRTFHFTVWYVRNIQDYRWRLIKYSQSVRRDQEEGENNIANNLRNSSGKLLVFRVPLAGGWLGGLGTAAGDGAWGSCGLSSAGHSKDPSGAPPLLGAGLYSWSLERSAFTVNIHVA